MENATYAARLRYLDADDVDDAVVDYDGLEVHGPGGEKLGNVDGFIIDADARRVNYVVIDTGGWFTSRRLLLPVGHASVSGDRTSLDVDVNKDALRRFPDFDETGFHELSDDELRAFERNTVLACCPDEPLEDVSVTTWGYDSRRHYTQPDWWRRASYPVERLRPVEATALREPEAAPVPSSVRPAAPVGGAHDRDLVRAREGADGDVSPHFDGRAQPGDVLGIETGGERTGIGETSEDEDARRRSAGRAAPADEPRPSKR